MTWRSAACRRARCCAGRCRRTAAASLITALACAASASRQFGGRRRTTAMASGRPPRSRARVRMMRVSRDRSQKPRWRSCWRSASPRGRAPAAAGRRDGRSGQKLGEVAGDGHRCGLPRFGPALGEGQRAGAERPPSRLRRPGLAGRLDAVDASAARRAPGTQQGAHAVAAGPCLSGWVWINNGSPMSYQVSATSSSCAATRSVQK